MKNWEYNEIYDAVEEYISLQNKILNNEKVKKSDIYLRLSEKHRRSPKAFEYRFSNISSVLSKSGKSWIKGLNPLANVGSGVSLLIEQAFNEIESKKNLTSINEIKNPKKENLVPDGNANPGKTSISISNFIRNQEVVKWVKSNSNGVCESCQKYAPFLDINGGPYLEVHHLKSLADGGTDTITNTVALCPNCHRELHFGSNSQNKKAKIYNLVKRLIYE
jgi:5-methylcytosine-specific restriction protein A